jgi:NAD(P)-dependent dehydrogenase (short-subunit alcohol dehydrogenase family)
MLSYEGKRAIVTGAGRGIGRAISICFARQGAAVTLTSRTKDELDAVAKEIRAGGGTAWVRPCDASDTDALEALIHDSAEQMGGLDVLVNNAGGGDLSWFGPIEDTGHDEFDAIMRLNLRGPFFGCVRAVKEMTARGTKGAILNIVSIDGLFPAPGEAVYGAAKAAMVSVTQGLAVEAGYHGIRVNAIAPSLIDTPLVASWVATPEQRQERSSYFPINRIGTAEDIANTAAFLCSDEAGWISGITILVAGGQQATSDVFRWVRAHNPVPVELKI